MKKSCQLSMKPFFTQKKKMVGKHHFNAESYRGVKLGMI